jgi:hypothetical protein
MKRDRLLRADLGNVSVCIGHYYLLLNWGASPAPYVGVVQEMN